MITVTFTLEHLLILTLISNILLFFAVIGIKIYDIISLKQKTTLETKHKFAEEQRTIYANRLVADKLEVTNTANFQSLEAIDEKVNDVEQKVEVVDQKIEEVHGTVKDVGIKADASYREANHANLKIQAVQDDLQKVLGLPQVPVTERNLKEVAEKKKE